MKMYRNGGYKVDEISPTDPEEDYEIMSKRC